MTNHEMKSKIDMIRAMYSLGEPTRPVRTTTAHHPLSDADGHQLYANGFNRAITFALAILTDGEEGVLPEATRQAIAQILKESRR